MSSIYFVSRSNRAQWVAIWRALAVALSGGPITQGITNKEIEILCRGWAYEGSSSSRGHCFANRQANGLKNYMWVEA